MTTGSPPPGDDDGPSTARIQPWEIPADPFATPGVRVGYSSGRDAGGPVVPEDQRFCVRCGSPVGRSGDGRSGLTEGFCPRCGTRFAFTPGLRRGAVVGERYEVLGAIAHGHTGWLYGATDLDRHRLVVLKPVADSGADLAASAGTSPVLAELDHPNIASIYGTVQHRDSGTVFVVMEYVVDPSLLEPVPGRHRRGRPAPLPITMVLPQGLQILSAVGYLHRNGLVHGDVTPDKIVRNGDQVKLIDLDTIRRIDDRDSPIHVTDGYAAPELAEDGPSVATDLYAVGRTLAALSFDFIDYTTTYHYTLPPPDHVRLFTRFPSYHRFLLRATDPDPSRRFESAEQMYDQLNGVLRESSSLEQPTPSRSVVFGEQPRSFGRLVVHEGTRSLLPLAAADVVGALPDTVARTLLSPVRGLIEQGRLAEARERLADTQHAADWLLTWHRGLLALADDEPAAAQAAFADVYAQLPGELAPKLALAASAELAGDLSTAARYYELVWRHDSWTIAEQAGDLTPDGMQRLLNFYVWDADTVRDDLRGYVLEHLTDPSGVFVADETGFLKKGTQSAGVQRQYSGTAGRIENCQLGVFLTYVTSSGRALLDRELYLPVSWTADRDRCRQAGIGDDVSFATKPQLAQRMLARVLDAGIEVGWFTADEAYGDNPGLRAWLETQQVNYVMAISCDTQFGTPTGSARVDKLAASAPKRGWQRLSCGAGSKGHRLYDWLLIDPGADSHPLLVRRSISSGELAYYIVHTTSTQSLAELVRVVGSRWGVEETFQFAKNETGLDHYQVRRYDAWYRHITLSMLAAAFLAVTAHRERLRDQKGALLSGWTV